MPGTWLSGVQLPGLLGFPRGEEQAPGEQVEPQRVPVPWRCPARPEALGADPHTGSPKIETGPLVILLLPGLIFPPSLFWRTMTITKWNCGRNCRPVADTLARRATLGFRGSLYTAWRPALLGGTSGGGVRRLGAEGGTPDEGPG